MQSMLEKKIEFADYDIAQSFILGLDRINEINAFNYSGNWYYYTKAMRDFTL